MSTTTIKSADKIKLLDQMLEDIAGDEFEDYDPAKIDVNTRAKHYTEMQELDITDIMH